MRGIKSRLKPIVFTVFLVVVFLGLALAGLEIYLRKTATRVLAMESGTMDPFIASNPDRLVRRAPQGRRLVPNARVTIANHATSGKWVAMRINNLGFRGADVRLPKKGQYRILVLGDSITWADYLHEEETWVRRMAHYLPAEVKGRRLEVINAGVGDTGLEEQVDLLEESGLAAEPDLVLVGFYLNDARPGHGFSNEISHRGWLRQHSLLAEKTYTALKLRRFIRRKGDFRFTKVRTSLAREPGFTREVFLDLAQKARLDWGRAWEASSWETVAGQFRRLRNLASENRFQVGVVCFPVAFQVYPDFLEDSPQKALARLCRETGFAYLDVLPVLRPLRGQDLFFDHCHPREAPNDVIGHAVSDFVQKQILYQEPVGAAR